MSDYSEGDRSKLHKIKEIIESMKKLNVSYTSIQDYVDKGIMLEESFVQKQIDNLIKECDKKLVSEYLKEVIKIQENSVQIKFEVEHQTLFKGNRTQRIAEDENPATAWGHYHEFLRKEHFMNIHEIRASALNILEMMSQETRPNVPVRGAVIGNVQSGKTANMEALISLAADNGWNFFVILTGLTTNLMEQTRDRMLDHLRKDGNSSDDPLIYNWIRLDPLTKAKDFCKKYGVDFNPNSHNRYICHAQKNLTHLKNIIQCLDKIPVKERIHLLIIDDESDQASVDSSKKEALKRSTINQLIINLAYNRTSVSEKGNVKKCGNPFGSVNYIGYTATPYANLLNEPNGLYPEDFITSLTPPPNYLGLKAFYGDGEEDGLNEHATVIDDEIGKIVKKRSSDPIYFPESLKDSIAWFYCCAGILKFRHFGKPVSMLINVDVHVEEHIKMNNAVRNYVLNSKEDLKRRCRAVYDAQTCRLTCEEFKEILPDYGGNADNLIIEGYPGYPEIESIVDRLINNGLTYIIVDEDKNCIYSPDTVHDCVDNGSGKSIPLEETGKGFTSRVIYPDKKENADVLKETPAFIVIGGQTLSRGLTIEGLVSTYFIRKTATADTCLQMARWFGFRRGYELLPRVWMDRQTYEAFCNLAVINQSLFEEIKKYNVDDVDPKDYHAKIMDVPASCMLKSLTSANKSKCSSRTYKNCGYRAKDKYPTKFYNRKEVLKYNLRLTEKLIANRKGEPSSTGSSVIFHRIPFPDVLEYLSSLKRPKEVVTINSFDPFMEWLRHYDPETIRDCNVILYGIESESDNLMEPHVRTFAGKYRINKVQRNRRLDNKGDDIIRFKTARDKRSLLMDLDLKECERLLESDAGSYQKLLDGDPAIRCRVRRDLGLDKTATLSITTIGVDSENGYLCDIIAPSIFIPGDAESECDFAKTPYVRMIGGL